MNLGLHIRHSVILLSSSCLIFFYSSAQELPENQKQVTRILFLLDGSGSMKEEWQGATRFETARKLLSHVIDSIERSGTRVEFGLRVFGHQFPRSAKNCKDSKLEVPFSPGNASRIKAKLLQVTPQGWTPIAYSLFLTLNDFPSDPSSRNAIVLITDGFENCDGDPCAAGAELQKKRITLRPFIIGMGVSDKDRISFDCVGTYYDASSRPAFQKALNVVVSQALNTTTTQVNLLDAYGRPSETDVEMSFYDAFSGEARYNLVHALSGPDTPDTLFLNPAGKYHLTVHTIPPVEKKDIELVPGKHNILALDAPQGTLSLQYESLTPAPPVQCLVRRSGSRETLYVQDISTTQKYITGSYDLEFVTLPRLQFPETNITQGQAVEIKIPLPGTLGMSAVKPGIASIYRMVNGQYEKIYEAGELGARITLSMQPGTYLAVYRPLKAWDAEQTKEQVFRINSSVTTNIQF